MSLPFKLLTRFQRMSGQKFRRRQTFTAFALQFKNPQRTLTATDNDAGFVCL